MGMRILYAEWGGGSAVAERVFRGETADLGCSPAGELVMAPELPPGERLGRLRLKGGTWTLARAGEDGVAVPVSFGFPFALGAFRAVLAPEEWVWLSCGTVAVAGPCAPFFSEAGRQGGLPLAGPFLAANLSAVPSKPWRFRVSGCGEPEAAMVIVPALEGGGAVYAGAVPPPFPPERLKAVRERETARVVFRPAEGGTGAIRTIPVLGPWCWTYSPEAAPILAAYVFPREPLVRTLVREAGALDGGLESLLRSGRPDAERACFKALYEALLDRGRILYRGPEEEALPGGARFQRVRPPREVLPEGGRPGEGTCLDLALLLASLLEGAGLMPVVLLLGDKPGRPEHAVAGCWLGGTPGPVASVTDAAFLRAETAAGRLLAVEATGVAEGFGAARMSFEEALACGGRRVGKAAWVAGADIGAARPPRGTVTPLDSPFDPDVVRIYEEAEAVAREKGRDRLEMSHLLYGACRAAGPAIKACLAVLGLTAEAVAARMGERMVVSNFRRAPASTRNFAECGRLAEQLAGEEGFPYVRESDLLWALVHKAGDSAAFRQAAAQAGLDLQAFQVALARRFPRARSIFNSSLLI